MKKYTDVERFSLGPKNFVVEIASNDGYLLQHFVARSIPVLGIEPAANIAKVAIEKGVPTLVTFFGESLARQLAMEGKQADHRGCERLNSCPARTYRSTPRKKSRRQSPTVY